ncbi:MAG: hypothetical protein PF638_13020 [Candidatus Delongbacteria bacterium]|jgi:hypothetical protein|nr:hypothetical protein [Candidatus Delongbacteria bacterium]
MSLSSPEEFRITLSSFYGRSFTLLFRDKKLVYQSTRPEEKLFRVPADEDWDKFWKESVKLKIWLWNKSYVDRSSSDGQNWSVKIKIGKMNLHSYGSGQFPENFENFLVAIRKLLGGLEFH